MDFKDKVVIRTPLDELWTSKEILLHKRKRNLGKEQIRKLIGSQPVEFVFADVGLLLVWTDRRNSFDIWKTEIEKHIIEVGDRINIDDYPENYGYLASEWTRDGALTIVLLEKVH